MRATTSSGQPCSSGLDGRALDDSGGSLRRARRRGCACSSRDLGGHDLADILDGARAVRGRTPGRPTVIFAYTIKGYGLEIAGRPQNHSALLDREQIDAFRELAGLDLENEWDALSCPSPEARLLEAAAARLERPAAGGAASVPVPATLGASTTGKVSTQAAFGRALLDLSRLERRRRPSGHGLAGRFRLHEPRRLDQQDRCLGCRGAAGLRRDGGLAAEVAAVDGRAAHRDGDRRDEPGAARSGSSASRGTSSRAPLLPIGTLYDPFVMRALEGIVYSTYSGSRFVLVGTPSGISLSREGGAHQSINHSGHRDRDAGARVLRAVLRRGVRMAPPGRADAGCRNRTAARSISGCRRSRSTRKPFAEPARAEAERRRSGGTSSPAAFACASRPAARTTACCCRACGAIVPETLAAADLLAERGRRRRDRPLPVVARPALPRLAPVTDRPPRDRSCPGARPTSTRSSSRTSTACPSSRSIDGSSHALAWLGSAWARRCVPLGVDRFGQTGSQPAVYTEYDIGPEAIATAALVALEAADSLWAAAKRS